MTDFGQLINLNSNLEEIANNIENIDVNDIGDLSLVGDHLLEIKNELSEIHNDLRCQNVLKVIELCADLRATDSSNFTSKFLKAWDLLGLNQVK